jgi:hypothetical protein
MIDRRSLVTGLLAILPTAALARDMLTPTGQYRVWIPDDWLMTKETGWLTAHAPDESLWLRADQMTATNTDLQSFDAEGFIDSELDDYDILRDEIRSLNGIPYRRVEGSGVDEGDNVLFRVRIVRHPTAPVVLATIIYGEPDDIADAQTAVLADKILKSIQPR